MKGDTCLILLVEGAALAASPKSQVVMTRPGDEETRTGHIAIAVSPCQGDGSLGEVVPVPLQDLFSIRGQALFLKVVLVVEDGIVVRALARDAVLGVFLRRLGQSAG